MFLRLLSSLICNAQKLIKKYYGYNIKLIKKNKKKSNNILTDTKTVNQLILRNAVSLCLPTKWVTYIKKLEKAVDIKIIEEVITPENNIKLYDILADKHVNTVYAKRLNAFGKKLLDGREKFVLLGVEEQCEILLQVLRLSRIGTTIANLKRIGASDGSGEMKISKNLKASDKPTIISQSVTGLYEKKEWIFAKEE